MRSRSILAAASLLVIAFGCKKTESGNTTTAYSTDTSSTSTAASGATQTETTGTTTGTGATGGTASTLADADKDFVMKAAQGGMAEVAMGSLAAQNGANADVKAFGNRMVNDHGKANDELKQLAQNKGLALPTEPDAEQKKTQDELSKKSGTDFDKAYIGDMVKDHEKDVAEFQKESTSAQDPDLKAWVTKTLPTLQDHLKMAKETQGKVK